MIKVGIVGCTGYTALEAIRILLRHPEAEITVATSRQYDGESISQVYPELYQRLDIPVQDLRPAEIADRCDVALCCLPHAASAPIVAGILDQGAKVIDLSADYRLSTAELYEQWYGNKHPDPDRLGHVPYGVPELFGEAMTGASLVAAPGCYPSSVILPLAPLCARNLIDPEQIVVDSKSGVSGAGRTPKLSNLYGEVNESFTAYGIGTHRHQPEMIDVLQRFCNVTPNLIFTPHLVPMERGILSTIYVRPSTGVRLDEIAFALDSFYAEHPFVRIVPHIPATKHVSRTNFCDIAVRQHGDWVVVVSALDNLVKGASGAAIQSMNVVYDLDPTLGMTG